MIRLLVVDDEFFSRDSICKGIDIAKLSISEVTTADDGINALRSAMDAPPNIVITDIRMPRMDGIELAYKIREFFPLCKLIFMSSYSDKEYLLSAIKLKTISYIEKPLNMQELNDVLKTAVTELKQDEKKEKSSRLAIESFKNELALDLVKKTMNFSRTIEELTLYNCVFMLNYKFQSVLIRFFHKHDEFASEIGLSKQRIYDLMLNALHEFELDALYGFKDDTLFIAHVYSTASNNSTPEYRRLSKALETVLVSLDKEYNTLVSVGINITGMQEIYISYQTATAGQEKAFFTGSNRIVYSSTLNDKCYTFSSALIDEFGGLLLNKNKEGAIRLIRAFSNEVKGYDNTPVNLVKSYMYKLALKIIDISSSHNITIFSQGYEEKILDSVYHSHTLDILAEHIINIVSLFFQNINYDNSNDLIWQIKNYINRNYHDPNLSIFGLSKDIGFTQPYLSTLFKNETGQTINAYITEVRMSKAKELLGHRELSLPDISQKVGFLDANYFSKLFKKQAHMTPSSYRKKFII